MQLFDVILVFRLNMLITSVLLYDHHYDHHYDDRYDDHYDDHYDDLLVNGLCGSLYSTSRAVPSRTVHNYNVSASRPMIHFIYKMILSKINRIRMKFKCFGILLVDSDCLLSFFFVHECKLDVHLA